MSRTRAHPWQDLRIWAEARGWSMRLTNGGHLRWTHASGAGPVYSAASPSDWRALRNVRALMLRFEREIEASSPGEIEKKPKYK